MRKIIFAAILSLVTVLCVSATMAEINNANSIDYASSVTATIAGDSEEIDFDTKTLVVIYKGSLRLKLQGHRSTHREVWQQWFHI